VIGMSDAGASTEASKMADLLSAASLLLTVLGVVYGAWYAEIIAAIGMPIPPHAPNRGPVRNAVRAALAKALPLALASVILTAIFLPDAVMIVSLGIHALRTLGCGAFDEYDAVEAAFAFVVLLTGCLAIYLIYLVCCLKGRLKKIAGSGSCVHCRASRSQDGCGRRFRYRVRNARPHRRC
jgi:hypothetical protein